jgi:hypothetical protein
MIRCDDAVNPGGAGAACAFRDWLLTCNRDDAEATRALGE